MNRFNKKYYFIILLFQLFNFSLSAQQLVSQPFAGHTSKSEINIWCMFKNADSVILKNSDLQTKTFIYKKEHCFRKFMPVNVHFSGLSENQTYNIQYSFNNKDFYPLINTKTNSDSLKDLSFLSGSCAFVPTGFNGAIKPFTSLKIFDYMKNDSADFMLWLGDNLYYIFDYHRYKGQLKRNIKTRLNKTLSNFLHSTQNYAIWDDHDYGSDNSDGTFKVKNTSLNVFQQFWPNPENDTFNYYTFKKQDCQFFMLDDRYNKLNDKVVLGNTQSEWLKNELLQSISTFKFIGIGIQALNSISTLECLYKTEKEYQELVSFIREHKISGVLFISGDRHHGELMRIAENDMYPLYDFTTSPLTMYPIQISKNSREFINPDKVEGTYFPSYNYGKITISGNRENRICTLELKDHKGNLVWKKEISANELQF